MSISGDDEISPPGNSTFQIFVIRQFVSALLKPDSNPAWVLSLARKEKIQLIMSPAIIDEMLLYIFKYKCRENAYQFLCKIKGCVILRV
jgi:hypothetical protein